MPRLDDNIINALIQVRHNTSTHRSRFLYRDTGVCIGFVVQIMLLPFWYYVNKKYDKRFQELIDGLYKQREEDLDNIEETPSIQIFELGDDVLLSIHHYEWCPELTAFIQVLTERAKTKLYKRKVQIKGYQKFITFQGMKYLLDESKIKVF